MTANTLSVNVFFLYLTDTEFQQCYSEAASVYGHHDMKTYSRCEGKSSTLCTPWQ
jgi:hypothetical protein